MSFKISALAHVHSRYSYDGKLSLLEIKEHCQKNGIQCVFMSEHTEHLSEAGGAQFIAECKKLSDKNFLFVPGFEVSFSGNHILCYGVQEYTVNISSKKMIQNFYDQGAVIVLAHPHRGGFFIEEDMKQLLSGVEVWNSQYDGKYVPRTKSISFFKKSKIPFAFAGIDLHRRSHFGGPHLAFEVETLHLSSVRERLAKGQFMVVGTQLRFEAPCPKMSFSVRIRNRILSFFFVNIIRFFRFLNSFFKKIGVTFPPSLKEVLRKWI